MAVVSVFFGKLVLYYCYSFLLQSHTNMGAKKLLRSWQEGLLCELCVRLVTQVLIPGSHRKVEEVTHFTKAMRTTNKHYNPLHNIMHRHIPTYTTWYHMHKHNDKRINYKNHYSKTNPNFSIGNISESNKRKKEERKKENPCFLSMLLFFWIFGSWFQTQLFSMRNINFFKSPFYHQYMRYQSFGLPLNLLWNWYSCFKDS